jgi:hypothetical protein
MRKRQIEKLVDYDINEAEMENSMGLEIDYETADRITLLTLKEHVSYLKKELKRHKKGEWMHPEDVAHNHVMIDAIKKVINYYGG